MEDFFYAGGLRALLRNRATARTTAPTVNGRTLGENIDGARSSTTTSSVAGQPTVARGRLAVLRGNLAPDGAVIKPPPRAAAAQAQGPAVVFENYDDLARASTTQTCRSTRTRCSCCGTPAPRGPGDARVGQLPIPKKLLEQGVRDMVRISDARMSGTSYGACVLHVAPESAVGGPLAWCGTAT